MTWRVHCTGPWAEDLAAMKEGLGWRIRFATSFPHNNPSFLKLREAP